MMVGRGVCQRVPHMTAPASKIKLRMKGEKKLRKEARGIHRNKNGVV